MAALIYNLKSRQPVEEHGGRDWSAQESAELYRVSHLLNEAGMQVALHIGRSDEGDPWAVFERRETAEVLVHVARSGDMLVVVNLQTGQTYRGRDFRAITNQLLRDAPLSVQQARNTGKVILHPSAIFSAFLIAAIASNVFLHSTQDAKASDEVKVAPGGVAGRDGQSLLAMLARAVPREMTSATMARVVSVGALAAAFIAFDIAHNGGHDVPTSVTDFLSGLGTLVSSHGAEDDQHAQALFQGKEAAEGLMANAHDVVTDTAATATPADVTAALEAALKLIAAVTASVTTYLDQNPPAHAAPQVVAHVADDVSVADDRSGHQSGAPAPAPAKDAAIQIDPSLDHAEVVDILHSIVSLSNLQSLGEAAIATPAAVDTLAPVSVPAAPASMEATDSTPAASVPDTPPPAPSSSTVNGYVLHQAGPVTQFEDGQIDVYLYNGQSAHIENFKFGEDLIAVGGNENDTAWIREISFSGNDVKIVGVNGSVLWLDGALNHGS